jgi:hypothetical protein
LRIFKSLPGQPACDSVELIAEPILECDADAVENLPEGRDREAED